MMFAIEFFYRDMLKNEEEGNKIKRGKEILLEN
jgi:hypothetical protein